MGVNQFLCVKVVLVQNNHTSTKLLTHDYICKQSPQKESGK